MNGIDGNRGTFRCPKCAKRFTYWRPDALPGAKVKCYYCGADFEDDAARRPPAAPPPSAAPPPPAAPPAS
ncbi:MAG TPA: hypothetical protein VKH46_02715 [Thermoanaerobaculia bacterium]|jgi:hypothetical protein|nr:hypothetical protein [Thermoanaerobaculia bacterium]